MKKIYSTTRSDYLRFLRNSQNENKKKKKKKKIGCTAGLAVYNSLSLTYLYLATTRPWAPVINRLLVVRVVKRAINWLCLAKVNSPSSSDVIYSSHVCRV
jgi:hypothetical protein